MMVTGQCVVDGVPHINGKPAIFDAEWEARQKEAEGTESDLRSVLSPYRCPECNANLSADSLICLNACHLSAAALRRFNSSLELYQK